VSKGEVSRDEWRAAYQKVVEYRSMHSYPMSRVTTSVRYWVNVTTGDPSLRPSQRHKRMNRIIDKLHRYPRMRLSQMEDIGGCRAVLPSLSDVYGVVGHITKRWPEAEVVDYVAQPKQSGYRAIHVVERRDGRLIEVQLRTRNQDQWAVAVETWAAPAVDFNLKDDPGSAPAVVCRYFQVAGSVLALADLGEVADDSLTAELNRLRQGIQPYIRTTEEQR
jgi:GTP pyrophosphokinase